jgi:septum formation protein
MRLVLASASPRRAELLQSAGIAFDVFPVDVDERRLPGEPGIQYVLRLAVEKAARASTTMRSTVEPASDNAPRIVLGADTAVVVGGDILGKPGDEAEATSMLRRLAGTYHEVITGISLRRGDQELRHAETTKVHFASLSDAEIAWYVRSGEGWDKAGGYAIQGLASRFVVRIEGSYSNVVGLPVASVYELLGKLEKHRSESSGA